MPVTVVFVDESGTTLKVRPPVKSLPAEGATAPPQDAPVPEDEMHPEEAPVAFDAAPLPAGTEAQPVPVRPRPRRRHARAARKRSATGRKGAPRPKRRGTSRRSRSPAPPSGHPQRHWVQRQARSSHARRRA